MRERSSTRGGLSWLGAHGLGMDLQTVDQLLTTTRSVRKRLDLERPVEPEVLEQCLRLALQAPTGSNAQAWRFLVVTDPDKRKRLAELYHKAFSLYALQGKFASAKPTPPPADPREQRKEKVMDSAVYLAENLHRVPVHVIPCYEGRVEKNAVAIQASFYGSILPAAWSFMLALRSRGLGSAWTTLHLMYEKQAAELLGIPDQFTQTCLLPVAYYQGDDFKPAARVPVEEVTYWNAWEQRR